MKILHVFKDYYPPTRGGVEQHIHDIVHSMNGFDFAVLTSSRTNQMITEEDAGVKVVRAPEYARPSSTAITPAWSRLLRESGADLLHFHMPNPFGELMFLSSRTKIPMVVTYHADIVGRRGALRLFRPFQSRFLSKARKIIVSNPRLAETSSALKRFSNKVIVPFGVDVDRWQERPAQTDEIRSGHENPLILFVGRLVYYKGLEVLIQAMKAIQATLLVVGDGPKAQALKSLSISIGVKEKVVFIGPIPDEERAAYYHAAKVFVLPSTSRAEAFGISMAEAMACGVPAVSTELGTGTSWVNVDGVTGRVARPNDSVAIAQAVNGLLRDEPTRNAMGRAAAARARSHFSKKAMLERLAEVYRTSVDQ